jgi:hypothetical protein
MATYKVLKTSFINNALYKEGDVVEWDGEAGDNLQKLSKKAAAAAATGDATDAADAAAADQPVA